MLGTLLGTKKPKKEKLPVYADENPFEMLGTGLLDSLKNDLAKPLAPTAIDQLVSLDHKEKNHTEKSGELQEGVEFDLRSLEEKQKERATQAIEAAIDYRRDILHGSERISAQENYELKTQIEQIQMEIESLMHASAEIETAFQDVAVQRVPVKVGTYHKTFLAFVLSALHTARLKVEDSANCLAMMSSKGKKKGYWQMFKNHGTSFGMSNERQVATQTG